MSRAALAVPTCGSTRPDFLAQPAPKALESSRYAFSSAGVSGVKSSLCAASISWSPRQVTSELSATPRGSKLTRS